MNRKLVMVLLVVALAALVAGCDMFEPSPGFRYVGCHPQTDTACHMEEVPQ